MKLDMLGAISTNDDAKPIYRANPDSSFMFWNDGSFQLGPELKEIPESYKRSWVPAGFMTIGDCMIYNAERWRRRGENWESTGAKGFIIREIQDVSIREDGSREVQVNSRTIIYPNRKKG